MDRFGSKVNCSPKVKINKDEPIRMIPMEEINPVFKYVEGSEETLYDGQGGAKFQTGDILMARITPCLENGKIAIAEMDGIKGVGSTEYYVFRGIKGVSDTDYVYYLLNTSYMRQMAINSMTGASGRQRADLGFIKRIKWEFPSYAEQKRISSILSPFDRLISINSKKIELLLKIINELYREWFARFRFPGAASNGLDNGAPSGWKEVRLGDLCSFVSRGITPSYVENGMPVLNQKCIRDGRVSFGNSKMTDRDGKYKKDKLVRFGDTLINSTGTGTLGRTAIFYYEDIDVFVDGHVTIVRADDSIYSFLVGFYLRNIEVFIENLGKGSTNQIELSGADIRKIKMLKPNDDDLVRRFNELATSVFKQIKLLEDKNRVLIDQRNAAATRLIMPKE